MSPVVSLPDKETVEWFLSRTRISVVYASGMVTPSIFPRNLLHTIRGALPSCDVGVATPRDLAKVALRVFRHGDCGVFAQEELVRHVADDGRPRHRERLLKHVPDLFPPGPNARVESSLPERLTEALKMATDVVNRPPAASVETVESLDPYEVLGVSPHATLMEIRRARKARMLEYHPDRVAALGAKLREVAETEARKINWAGSVLEQKRRSSM